MEKRTALARTFVDLADTLVADFDVVDMLTVLVSSCVEVFDVAAAGIMLARLDGKLGVVASSSEAMRMLELFEVQSREGPCLDCYHIGRPVLSLDLTPETARWPRFVPEALAAGFSSVHALPMRLRGNVIGALNLFHVRSDEMAEVDVDAAQALADVATIAILQDRAAHEALAINSQLHRALNSRIVIEQAKGIVADHNGLTMEEAFRALRNHSRHHNVRMVEIAQRIVNGSFNLSELDQLGSPRQS